MSILALAAESNETAVQEQKRSCCTLRKVSRLLVESVTSIATEREDWCQGNARDQPGLPDRPSAAPELVIMLLSWVKPNCERPRCNLVLLAVTDCLCCDFHGLGRSKTCIGGRCGGRDPECLGAQGKVSESLV